MRCPVLRSPTRTPDMFCVAASAVSARSAAVTLLPSVHRRIYRGASAAGTHMDGDIYNLFLAGADVAAMSVAALKQLIASAGLTLDGAPAWPECPVLQQLMRPPAAPGVRPLAQGGPVGLRGDP